MSNRDDHTLAPRRPGAPMLPLARGLARALGLSAALTCPAPVLAGNTFLVNTTGDPGLGNTLSLRQAVAAANASDGNTVQFDPSLAGSTITLATGEILVSRAMDIVGIGAENLAISGNDASRIFKLACSNTSAQVSISSLTLTHGKSDPGTGGALYAHKCKLQMSGVHVSASTAGFGGGVSFDNGSITNSIVTGCSAGEGGGILVRPGPGDIHIYQSTISFNTAHGDGGGVLLSQANAYDSTRVTVIDQSTINNNTVTQTHYVYGGGGIRVVDSRLKLARSTVTANQIYKFGAGIEFADAFSANSSFVYQSTVSLNSSTNTADSPNSSGNGIFAVDGTVLLLGSIVAGNFNKYRITDLRGNFSAFYSLVEAPDGATITGNGSLVGVDPDLADLADNGGPTKTLLPNPGSPALDKIPFYDSTDQRGVPTNANGLSDIGSVERQIPEVMIFRNGFESG